MRKVIAVVMLLLTVLLGIGLSQKRRQKAKPKPKPKAVARSLVVKVISSAEMICSSGECPTRESSVNLSATSTDPTNAQLTFQWTVTGGKLMSTGSATKWNLNNVFPGVYTASVKVSDQQGGTGNDQVQIRVVSCGGCQNSTPCPVISVSCPDEIDGKARFKFLVTVAGGPTLKTPPTYLWTVSSGKITNGDTSSDIDVDAAEDEDEIRGTVYVGGYDPDCSTIASCTSKIKRSLP